MLKKYVFPIVLIVIAFALLFLTNALTFIDSQGIIHEPFYLIVLAKILFLIGLIWAIIISIQKIKNEFI